MNLIFLSIFEEFQNLFKDGFLSRIDTDALADSNARDLVRSYFERNPLPEMDSNNPGMEIIINGLANVQNFVGEISMGEGSLIASAPILLLAASVVIILGVLGEAFFKKTGIPDIAFLMILGVMIGPVFGIVQPAAVIEIVPYFAALALIIIMFDGGYNLKIGQIIKTAHFSLILVILGFAAAVGTVGVFGHYGLGWEWLDSILLGTIVGGSSSIIVFGLVRKLRISDKAKSMLSFESALTDILSTIVAFILFEAVLSGTFSIDLLGETIGSYMLTLGVLFLLFFLATSFGESGALTALVFGLMLGNKRYLLKKLRIKLPEHTIDNSLHSQVTFIVRAFFFVFVGLLASFGQIEYVIFGIIAAVAIYVGRIIITHTALVRGFSRLDKSVTSVMIPRGLAAAVLATIPLTMGLQNGEAYPQIIFFIILTSVIITTIGLGRAKKIPPPEGSGGFVTETKDK
jgi:cell volume regulation protein A